MVRFVRLKQVFCDDIDRKGSNSDTKTREDVAEHGAVGENGMFTPCFTFCPWVPVQRGWIGHLPNNKGAQRLYPPKNWTVRRLLTVSKYNSGGNVKGADGSKAGHVPSEFRVGRSGLGSFLFYPPF